MPLYTSEVSVDNTPLPVTVSTALPAGTNVIGHVITDSGSTTSISNATIAVTQSTSPWVVSLASTTITGTVTVAGGLTNNNATPTANNIGVLPAVASSSVPTYTTGDQVLLSTDLSGNLRVTIDSSAAEQSVNLNQVGGSAISIGQAAMAASLPVVLASNQSSIPVTLASTTITGTVAVTQSTSPWVVSGTVTANAGTGTFNIQANASTNLNQVAGSAVVTAATGIQKVGISDSAGASITNGQKASANSVPVVIASDQTAVPVNVSGGNVSSATVTSNSVGSGAAVTLLASRAARIRGVIFNESGTLFVKAGSTASSSDYTWRLTANTELDITDYTGIVTAIKSSGTSNVQATDF